MDCNGGKSHLDYTQCCDRALRVLRLPACRPSSCNPAESGGSADDDPTSLVHLLPTVNLALVAPSTLQEQELVAVEQQIGEEHSVSILKAAFPVLKVKVDETGHVPVAEQCVAVVGADVVVLTEDVVVTVVPDE